MSNKNLIRIVLNDRSLFGNEAAEDESEDVFNSYAVDRPEVSSFLNPDSRVAIVRAYKGEGKSALLRLVTLRLRRENDSNIVISIAASAVSPTLGKDEADSDRWVREWKFQILKHVAGEVGKQIGVAFSDDAMSLVEEAQSNGFKNRSFVYSVLRRLKLSSGSVDEPGVSNPERVLQRWSGNNKNKVWIIIDDLDQNFENTPVNRIKVASFFVAIRQISNLIPEFVFRTSVRPNIWSIVKRESEALSHVEQYMSDLKWSIDDFSRIISKRIEGYLDRSGQLTAYKKSREMNEKSIISCVFDDPMPWGEGRYRPPTVVLYTLARQRPRWLVELWRVAANSAVSMGRERIGLDDIKSVLEDFGRRRIEDTVAEFRSQCPQIEELLVAFSAQPERLKTDELIKLIKNRVFQAVHPRIVGISGSPSEMEVAHFLYQIGFLTARKDLGGGRYEHLSFAENPTLLSARTNLDQGHSWEIHPVFRQALKLKNF